MRLRETQAHRLNGATGLVQTLQGAIVGVDLPIPAGGPLQLGNAGFQRLQLPVDDAKHLIDQLIDDGGSFQRGLDHLGEGFM